MNDSTLARQMAAAEQTIEYLRGELAASRERLEKARSEQLRVTSELEERLSERTEALERARSEIQWHRNYFQEQTTLGTAELEKINAQLRKSLRQFRESEEQFRSLVTTIPDIVYRIDPDGRFLFLNKSVERLGYRLEELIGRHFSHIILPSDLERASRSRALARPKTDAPPVVVPPKLFDERRTGDRQTTRLEVCLVAKHANGNRYGVMERLSEQIIQVEVNSAGIYEIGGDSGGRVFIGTVGVIRDISERKAMEDELRESQNRMKTILDYTEAGIVIINPRTRCIVEANPAAVRMLGTPLDRILGRVCHRYICPAQAGQCPVIDRKQRIEATEGELLTVEGQRLPILKTVTEVILKGEKHLLESFVDISQIKEAQRALARARDTLEAQVQERTRELTAMNQTLKSEVEHRREAETRLKASMEQLRAFQERLITTEKMGALGTLTAGIAHEMNNPLMGILNFVQYGIRRTTRDPRVHGVLLDTEKEVQRCIDILRNLLTFAQVENPGKSSPEPVCVFDLIQRVLGLLNCRIEKEKVRVNCLGDRRLTLFAHVGNLQQVFLNLMENALDAVEGMAEKAVTINVEASKSWAEIRLEDTGPGVSREHRPKVFDPFFTTKPTGRGTGMGLAISAGIIRDHGGDLFHMDRQGPGACFTVRLPLEASKEKERGK